MRCYRLPLKLIARGTWADITHAAKAVLPPIGLHADNNGKAFPGIRVIQKLSGCADAHTVHSGIHSLISHKCLVKEKEGRHNVYYLINNAIWQGGSYFPMNENFFLYGTWAELFRCEKAVFGVLCVKASILNPDMPPELEMQRNDNDIEVFSFGIIQPMKFRKLAGVSRWSWYKGLRGLDKKNLIATKENNQYVVYK